MNQKDILRKIIAENGSCEWVMEVVEMYACDVCPLGKMATRDDGGPVSCIEAVYSGLDKSTSYATDADYLRAAQRKLLELDAEEILLQDDDAE
jgi:hypothetical protein